MKEYMLIIKNERDNFSKLNSEQQTQFLKKCRIYIENLRREKILIEAQPLEREGTIISKTNEEWNHSSINETKEIQVGYYHILANNFEEAISIAKKNPEFEYGKTARIEVRPIKLKEESTGFTYPKIS